MRTIIDWLTFRTLSSAEDILPVLQKAFGQFGHLIELGHTDRPILGFDAAFLITMDEGRIELGRIEFGGAHMRGWNLVNLNGSGLRWVQNLNDLESLGQLRESAIRRIDIALDIKDGSVGHQQVLDAHEAGGFRQKTGPKPVMRTIASTDDLAGRTCYIGSRSGYKFVRCYEKGLKELPNLSSPEKVAAARNWYRVELELKAKDDRTIPWDAVSKRDNYFAGANPFLASLCESAPVLPPRTGAPLDPSISLEHALANIRSQYGSVLFTALAASGGDISGIWDRICARTHSKRLLSAGVLTSGI